MKIQEILSDAFPVIQRAAPLLASTLGSPLAGIATSWALSAVAHVFGIKPEYISHLSDTILGDPDAEKKLSGIEEIFKGLSASKETDVLLPDSAEINIRLTWDKKQVNADT